MTAARASAAQLCFAVALLTCCALKGDSSRLLRLAGGGLGELSLAELAVAELAVAEMSVSDMPLAKVSFVAGPRAEL